MCGRYYLSADALSETEKFLTGSSDKSGITPGDICPSQAAPVFHLAGKHITVSEMLWGFPGGNSNDLVINARAETLLSKPLFRDSARYRRCVIPAGHYYEWNSAREKVTFSVPDGKPLFLAGIYNLFDNHNRFAVVTTGANDSVRGTHHRMPLILSADQLDPWLWNADAAAGLLLNTPEPLLARQDYRQQSLFDL